MMCIPLSAVVILYSSFQNFLSCFLYASLPLSNCVNFLSANSQSPVKIFFIVSHF